MSNQFERRRSAGVNRFETTGDLRTSRAQVRIGVLVALLVALVVAGCSGTGSDAGPSRSDDPVIVERGDWEAIFQEHEVSGTFALHEIGADRVFVHDPERAATPMIPASTFKILNSLIALETGVVDDVDDTIAWDGVVRGIEAWNRDHSLRTAIEVSAVWMYQHLARSIGPERMGEAVRNAEYGNADIGGPIDEFWLRGDLRISPLEQVDVMVRLMTDDLPFETQHQSAVREILIRDRGDGWVWGHKTGTVLSARPVLGWLVGYTEFDGSVWVFAMNVDLGDGVDPSTQIDPEVRLTLSREILEEAGALPVQ